MSDHPAPSPDSSAEMEVPDEVRRTSAGGSFSTGCLLAAIVIVLPALLYFGFFGVLLIDGLVLKTHYFSSANLSQEVIDWLVIIYWPLIYPVQWAMNR